MVYQPRYTRRTWGPRSQFPFDPRESSEAGRQRRSRPGPAVAAGSSGVPRPRRADRPLLLLPRLLLAQAVGERRVHLTRYAPLPGRVVLSRGPTTPRRADTTRVRTQPAAERNMGSAHRGKMSGAGPDGVRPRRARPHPRYRASRGPTQRHQPHRDVLAGRLEGEGLERSSADRCSRRGRRPRLNWASSAAIASSTAATVSLARPRPGLLQHAPAPRAAWWPGDGGGGDRLAPRKAPRIVAPTEIAV